jgi:hypothetical protein
MGGNNSNAATVNPWSEGESPKSMPADMRRELFSLPGPVQGPERPAIQGPTPRGTTPRTRGQRIDQITNMARRASPMFNRRNKIAYGTAAAAGGLSALIGGERDQREQEQYS